MDLERLGPNSGTRKSDRGPGAAGHRPHGMSLEDSGPASWTNVGLARACRVLPTVFADSQRSRAKWAPIAWASGIGTALPICRAMATFDPTHL